jgi:hypothetical protein
LPKPSSTSQKVDPRQGADWRVRSAGGRVKILHGVTMGIPSAGFWVAVVLALIVLLMIAEFGPVALGAPESAAFDFG